MTSIYQIIEFVGTSDADVEDAINKAIAQVTKTHGNLAWYEVMETHGYINGSNRRYYQAHLKIGCNAH